MANINHKPSKYLLNLLHVLPPFVDEEKGILNTIIEINPGTISKYELITESGQLKLDRVGYSSLAYPCGYGAIPQTLDYDDDALDVLLVNITEPIVPGSLTEVRIIGMMKFEDEGAIDDKIIGVLSCDRRSDHIKSINDLGEQFKKETVYFFEHLKYLKKPNTGITKGFFDTEEAIKVVKDCEKRYKQIYLPKFD